jgi:hypothetical protein
MHKTPLREPPDWISADPCMATMARFLIPDSKESHGRPTIPMLHVAQTPVLVLGRSSRNDATKKGWVPRLDNSPSLGSEARSGQYMPIKAVREVRLGLH